MKAIFNILISLTMIVGLWSCEEEDDFGVFLRPNIPEIPVTYPNATTWGGNPFIELSLQGTGDIEFIMEIPENSGRSILELTTVAAGNTSVNTRSLTTQDNYLDTPVPGSGNRVIFNTTLSEFSAKRPNIDTDAGDVLGFIFEITLDNNSVIIPIEVEVRLVE